MVSNNLEVDMITSLSGEVYEKGELLDKIEAPLRLFSLKTYTTMQVIISISGHQHIFDINFAYLPVLLYQNIKNLNSTLL